MTTPGDPAYLADQRADLLRFAERSLCPEGFGWLLEDGSLDVTRPVELWITCRMTHVAALGLLAGEEPAPGGPDASRLAAMVDHGVRALQGPLRDTEHGGWFASVDARGPVEATKQAYGHAFVVLAASSAAQAGAMGADELLAEALAVAVERFWDDAEGLVLEEWDRTWTVADDYRGMGGNLHLLEAFLAAGDVTRERRWHELAARILVRVLGWAEANDWRVPNHFTAGWEPLLEYNRDDPAHPFRPYGANVGDAMEWARLSLAVAGSLGEDAPPGLVVAAVSLYDRASSDGWAADGADGFVYTTDWEGKPVIRSRMHWVVAEALNAARALHLVTGDGRFARDAERWWAYVDACFVDREAGSWRHELDEQNRQSRTVWQGKPDIYHAYQAAVFAALPVAPSFARALAERGGRVAGRL